MSRPAVDGQGIAPADAAAAAFAAAMFDAYREAECRCGVSGRSSYLAGRCLELRSAGPTMLETLAGPLQHLRPAGEAEAEITVLLFDTASTGVEAPPFPWPLPEIAPGTRPVLRHDQGGLYIASDPVNGSTQVVDRNRSVAVFHIPDALEIPIPERVAPLRSALDILLWDEERWLIHAAAVGEDGLGALLAGRGGAGKSTLAIGCAIEGMEICGDDYVVIEAGDPAIAHAFISTGKLTGESVDRLGLDRARLPKFESSPDGRVKTNADLSLIAPGRLRQELEIRAVIAPTVAGLVKPVVRPFAPPETLRRLAPSTVMQQSARGQGSLSAMARISRSVPGFSLGLSTDARLNAAAVREVIASVSPS